MKSPLLQKKKKPVEKDVSYKSDMIGMPGSATRKKVEKDMKGKKVDSPAKMIKEYGKVKSPIKQTGVAARTIKSAVKLIPKSTAPIKGTKEAPVKMKKC